MKTSDIETRLDDALTRLAGGASNVDAAGNDADVQELVHVAQRLQALAPAPEPRLADSRRRFLAQAARLADRRSGAHQWLERAVARRALAFAVILFVLLAGSAAAMAMWSAMTGRQATPNFQVTLTQTVAPTYSATPVRDSQAPVVPLDAKRPQMPEPCPTPGTLAMLTTTSAGLTQLR